MALSIGAGAGDRIRVGEDILHVREVHPSTIVICKNDDAPVLITEDAKVDIIRSVFIFKGISPASTKVSSRLAFEAPKSIRIERIP